MYLRKRDLFFTLVLVSSFIAAIIAAIDSSIINNFSTIYPVEKVPWLFTFSSFFIGLIITFIFCIIFSVFIRGKSIGSRFLDPSFERLRLIDRSEIVYHVLAGFGNAAATVGYFTVLSLLIDPSMVLPFKQIVIIYLILVECFVEKNTPTLIEIQSSFIVMFGAILSSISFIGELNIQAILIMLIVVNPGMVFVSISQRKLMLLKIKDKPNDSINVRLWNLVFTFGFAIVFLIVFDLFNGTSYIIEGFESSLIFFWPVALSMSVVLFSALAYIRALRIGKTSVAQAIRSSTVLFSVPISLILCMFMYIPFPDSPIIWFIRVIGFILIILGIVTFALSEIKGFIFIKIDPKVKIQSILDNVGKIHGVESLSVVFGERYDIIVNIRSRTLLKGYTQIIRKLETIRGIKEFRFISILKEWENI